MLGPNIRRDQNISTLAISAKILSTLGPLYREAIHNAALTTFCVDFDSFVLKGSVPISHP
jgi:hypothetical protein